MPWERDLVDGKYLFYNYSVRDLKPEEITDHRCGPVTGGICGKGRYCSQAGWCNNGAGSSSMYRFCNGDTDKNCVASLYCTDTGSTGKCVARIREAGLP